MRSLTFVCSVLLICAAVPLVGADERGFDDHYKGHMYYQDLYRPDTGASCCNNQDCRSTSATYVDGSWIAMWNGEQVVIPGNIVLSTAMPDGKAHICAGSFPYFKVYCFVPPAPGF